MKINICLSSAKVSESSNSPKYYTIDDIPKEPLNVLTTGNTIPASEVVLP